MKLKSYPEQMVRKRIQSNALVSHHLGRHHVLVGTGQRMEMERTVPIDPIPSQRYSEDSVGPLEIDACHVVVSIAGLQVEEVVVDPPRLVGHPRINNQTIGCHVGDIGEGVLAVAS